MSYELITILMFALMMLMLATGQRVFAAIGFVAVLSALLLWGDRGGYDLGFAAAMKLMKWYPLLTLPMFIFMGYVLSESKIADDLYRMFHVWTGGMAGGLAMGTIGLMVLVSAMNGLSVAGMAIGATIALPELLRRNYDKRMVTGVIQAGSSLGILVPPSVVLVLYAMIARQPVGQLWLAGLFPGLMMASLLFILYIYLRCRITPNLGPALPKAERDIPWPEKVRLLRAGLLPLFILRGDDGALRQRLDLAGRIVRHRRARRPSSRPWLKAPHEPGRVRELGAQDAPHLLHVHVDHPGGAGLRRGVRRAGRRQGDREPVHRAAGALPWMILILMQLSSW